MKLIYSVCIFLLLFISVTTYAATADMYPFKTPQRQQQFHQLIQQLRCLVCQNQDLADSNAPLAKDLRFQVFQMIRAGKTNKQIKAFLVSRYGDFILFKPPVNRSTYLLWFSPFVLLFIALLVLVFWVKYRKKSVRKGALSDEEKDRLDKILKDQKQ